MATGNHYRLKLLGNLLTQDTVNIFHYRNDVVNLLAIELDGIFRSDVLPSIQNICSSDMTFTGIEVVNLDNVSDFFISTFTAVGLRGGTTTAPYGSWGFLMNPILLNYKAGGKRFGGISNIDAIDGIPVGSHLLRLSACALNLGKQLTVSGGTFKPQLFSKRCVKDADKHCTDTFVESFVTIVSSVFDVITTQNSRKFRS